MSCRWTPREGLTAACLGRVGDPDGEGASSSWKKRRLWAVVLLDIPAPVCAPTLLKCIGSMLSTS